MAGVVTGDHVRVQVRVAGMLRRVDGGGSGSVARRLGFEGPPTRWTA
ncbi:MAG: hypothetical protein OXD37_01580 [Acidimicrobiaceae bacterium]|nr:hypothetical protein [Acidimicrobiaceae bacterium]